LMDELEGVLCEQEVEDPGNLIEDSSTAWRQLLRTHESSSGFDRVTAGADYPIT